MQIRTHKPVTRKGSARAHREHLETCDGGGKPPFEVSDAFTKKRVESLPEGAERDLCLAKLAKWAPARLTKIRPKPELGVEYLRVLWSALGLGEGGEGLPNRNSFIAFMEGKKRDLCQQLVEKKLMKLHGLGNFSVTGLGFAAVRRARKKFLLLQESA